jgi:DNA invertase Pin-like site-specific DNA recombinase
VRTPPVRDGFQKLVSEVALGKVGIILGLEVSRLARNSADWHRLIELCSLTDSLILDEDGVYDPASFNDRLLLGLKGTMSEAELHVLKARMRGGQLSKAQRGELEMAPPVGLVTRKDGRIVLDPDASVQSVIRLVFDAFQRTGSAFLTVRFLREENILFPRRLRASTRRIGLEAGAFDGLAADRIDLGCVRRRSFSFHSASSASATRRLSGSTFM